MGTVLRGTGLEEHSPMSGQQFPLRVRSSSGTPTFCTGHTCKMFCSSSLILEGEELSTIALSIESMLLRVCKEVREGWQ